MEVAMESSTMGKILGNEMVFDWRGWTEAKVLSDREGQVNFKVILISEDRSKLTQGLIAKQARFFRSFFQIRPERVRVRGSSAGAEPAPPDPVS